MTGRPTKFNSKLQKRIIKLLSDGATVTDTCAHVGIHKQTFYNWLERGEADDPDYVDFFDAVTRAYNAAKVTAIGTLKVAMLPRVETQMVTKTYTETRLGKDGEPYEYKEVTRTVTKTPMLGDWRAAVEYLKRRFPEEWTDHVHVDDWRTDAIGMIKRGELTYDGLAEAFDTSLAAELFAAAGVPVQAGEGETS